MNNAQLVEKLYDIYWAISHGYTVSAESIVSNDGLPAIESIGRMLRDCGRLPRHEVPALLKRAK